MIEYFLVMEFLVVGILSIVYDFKAYRVPNLLVLYAFIITTCLQIVYFIQVSGEGLALFLVQVIAACICSFFMYFLKIWGGGDTKLFIVLAMMVPFSAYKEVAYASIFYILIYIYSLAFIYIVIESVVLSVKGNTETRKTGFFSKMNIRTQLFNWVFLVASISLMQWGFRLIFPKAYVSYQVVFLYANVFFVLLMWKTITMIPNVIKIVTILAFVIVALVRILNGSANNFQFAWGNYLIAFLVFALRIWAGRHNYKRIKVDELQPGMILSSGSVLMFANSRVKGLPDNISEDMSARIKESEIESIKRWSKTNRGSDELLVVRKIPFVVFMVIGFGYFIIRNMQWSGF